MKKILIVGDSTIDENLVGSFKSCSSSDSSRAFQEEARHNSVGCVGNIHRIIQGFDCDSVTVAAIPRIGRSEEIHATDRAIFVFNDRADFDTKSRFFCGDTVVFRSDKKGLGLHPREFWTGLSEQYSQSIREAEVVVISDYGKGFVRGLGPGFYKLLSRNAVVLYEGKYNPDFAPDASFRAVIQKTSVEDFSGDMGARFMMAKKTTGAIYTAAENAITIFSRSDDGHHAVNVTTCPGPGRLPGFHTNGAGDRFLAYLAIHYARVSHFGSPGATGAIKSACADAVRFAERHHDICKKFDLLPWDQVNPSGGELDGVKSYSFSHFAQYVAPRLRRKPFSVINGCFDLVHEGHMQLIETARKNGPVVIFINDDNSIRSIKGEGRPFRPLDDRIATLFSNPSISAIVPFGGNSPANAYAECGIHRMNAVLFKGAKDKQNVPSTELALFKNVVFVEGPNASTTDISRKVRK